MKTLTYYLTEYQLSHQNPINKKLHWLCIPLIMQSIVGMALHFNVWLTLVGIALAIFYYVKLSVPLALAMALFFILLIAVALMLPISTIGFLTLFLLAWVGQFYGHKKEGKKPSFFTDLQYLLIGPAWCAQSLLQKLKASRSFASPN